MSTSSPSIKILEQPAADKLRFRYESERLSSALEGISSTKENKKYPTIQVIGQYAGTATIGISLVTHTEPYRPHPHKIIYKDNCQTKARSEGGSLKIGVYGMEPIAIDGITVMCVKKDNIRNVENYKSFDLNAVRLAFDLYINGEWKCRVFSDPIYDSKSKSKLGIYHLSCESSVVSGEAKIMLFCDKVQKNDVVVQFHEKINDVDKVWSIIESKNLHVHHQVGILFKAPKYHKLNIDQPVQTYLRLMRPSDGFTGPSIPFQFYPTPNLQTKLTKRPKISANAIGLPDVLTKQEDLVKAKRHKLAIRNVKPEIATATQPLRTKDQEKRLNQPSVSSYTQQLTQFQQPARSFQTPAYPTAKHQNHQMCNTQATNACPPVNRNYATQNHNADYIQARFDGNIHQGHGNNFVARNPASFEAPMPQPQYTPSNWNILNHSTGNWYREGNNATGEYPAIPNGGMITYKDNFSSILRHNDKPTLPNTCIVPHNINIVDANLPDLNSDFLDIDVNFFNNSFSRLSVDGNNENTPTR